MAFFNRASSILRQAASKNINHEISASKPSIFQMIRCMSSSECQLIFGGLKYNTNDTILRKAFEKYGDVIEARVVVDRTTSESSGLGFVIYSNPEAVSAATQAIKKQEMHVFKKRVNFVGGGCSDGYGDGGYGGGGYWNIGYGGDGGGYGGGGGDYGGGGVGYGDGYSWGGCGFSPVGFNYLGGGRGGYGDNVGGYRGGGDSFSDAGGFGADGNREDQLGSNGGLSNLGGSDGGFSQQDARISFGDDAQDDYANKKAQ